ncbi:MAG: BadF/BadG/BcrA/BcrD ATPase family protein [Terriglobia bacterium]
MTYFLGIDGGGTRTTACLSTGTGKILARAVVGPTNPLKVGFEATERELLRAAREVLRRARLAGVVPGLSPAGSGGAPKVTFESVCVGLAGVDRPQVHGRLFRWLRRAIPARHHWLTSDADIALRAAIGHSPGVIVISGTGSIAYGRDDRGRVLRSGGWGVPFDDCGSGYDVGRKAIIAALRDYDGRGPYTQLTQKICRALKIPDITHVVLKSLTPKDVAALFPLVLDAARRRDAVALTLCDEAGRDLAELAVALLRRMGWLRRVVPVVYAGGVFRASLRIRRSVTRHIRRQVRHARILLLRHPPVEGALALARDLAESAQGRESGSTVTKFPRVPSRCMAEWSRL